MSNDIDKSKKFWLFLVSLYMRQRSAKHHHLISLQAIMNNYVDNISLRKSPKKYLQQNGMILKILFKVSSISELENRLYFGREMINILSSKR